MVRSILLKSHLFCFHMVYNLLVTTHSTTPIDSDMLHSYWLSGCEDYMINTIPTMILSWSEKPKPMIVICFGSHLWDILDIFMKSQKEVQDGCLVAILNFLHITMQEILYCYQTNQVSESFYFANKNKFI